MTGPTRRELCLTMAAGCLALGPGLRRRPGASWVPAPTVRARLPVVMDVADVPGVGLAVVEGGRLEWEGSFGVMDADTKAPVTGATMFPAASLGKPVFGWVVLLLAQEGSLDLDRPLVGYVRPDGLGADPRLDRITARHVLSHSSGLPNWRPPSQPLLTTDFEPGARFQYSGEGFFWLAQVVEAVTGTAVDVLMRARLFDPLGMTSSTYAWSAEVARRAVSGHDDRGRVASHLGRDLAAKKLAVADAWGRPIHEWKVADGYRALALAAPDQPRIPSAMLPNVAASLMTTPADYARFLTAVVDEGSSRAALAPATRAALLRPWTPLKPGLSWGLGLGLELQGPDRYVWHWGDNGIYRAFMLGDPARGRALAIFTNSESGPKAYQWLVRTITGLDLAAFLWV